MSRNYLLLVLLFAYFAEVKSQINDSQNLLRDVEVLMYSEPHKALKTAQYIIANPTFGSTDDIYHSYLFQAEIFINLKKYNDAVFKLISADKISTSVSNDYLKAKNEYLIAKIYQLTGFQKSVSHSIIKMDDLSNSFQDEEKKAVELWKSELEIRSFVSDKKYKEALALIQNKQNLQSELYPTFAMELHQIQSEIENKPYKIDFRNNSYFKFLSDINLLKSKILTNDFQESDLLAFKKQNPQYGEVFYKDLYKYWSEKVCNEGNSEDCFRVRKEYIKLLKFSISDLQYARVNIINLIDQKEKQISNSEKDFQNKTLFALFFIAFLSVVGYLIYFLVLKNRIKMVNSEIEKRIISDEYEQKLSNQLKNFQASNVFVIPEKTENLILSKLNIFENSKDVTDPHLSLAVLAKRLDTNSKYLSEIINKHKEKNFNNYLNELRVKYIVDKLENNPEYLQYKTSYLAEEAGFASRTTFTTIFKNVTGTSPSQFIDQLKNK